MTATKPDRNSKILLRSCRMSSLYSSSLGRSCSTDAIVATPSRKRVSRGESRSIWRVHEKSTWSGSSRSFPCSNRGNAVVRSQSKSLLVLFHSICPSVNTSTILDGSRCSHQYFSSFWTQSESREAGDARSRKYSDWVRAYSICDQRPRAARLLRSRNTCSECRRFQGLAKLCRAGCSNDTSFSSAV
jgi:hypothetical protein